MLFLERGGKGGGERERGLERREGRKGEEGECVARAVEVEYKGGGGEKIAGAEHHFHFMRKEFLSDKSL